MVDDILAREVVFVLGVGGRVLVSDVAVQIDQRGHDRLAGEVDARGTGWCLDLTGSADARHAIALDEKSRVLDRSGAVADNHPGTLEQRRRRCRGFLAGLRRGTT